MKIFNLAKDISKNIYQTIFICQTKGLNYSDIYPEIDDAYKELFITPSIKEKNNLTSMKPPNKTIKNRLSTDAMKLVDKLERHGKWGKHKDPVNRYNKQLDLKNLDDVINDLASAGWLCEEGRRGCEGHAFSLNSSNKVDIEEELKIYRKNEG